MGLERLVSNALIPATKLTEALSESKTFNTLSCKVFSAVVTETLTKTKFVMLLQKNILPAVLGNS